MKRTAMFVMFAIFMAMCAWSNAQEAEKPRGEGLQRGRPAMGEFIKKYDKDGDGKLSEEERAELKKDMEKRREEMILKRFDKDGDGVLSDEEKKAAEEARPKGPAGRPGMRGPGQRGPGPRGGAGFNSPPMPE